VEEESGPAVERESSSPTSQGVRDLIERVFLLGVGAAALTKDRVQELVEDLVRRGQLSGDEGREVADRLIARSREEAKAAAKKADSSLQGAYREMGLVTRREIEDIEFRLRQLEHRVQLLEAAEDAPSESAPGGSVGGSAST
jgi:polyhydroxyalkanoate synthesis regulator phasin